MCSTCITLAIAAVVNINKLPPELATDQALLCGRVAGAASPAAGRGIANYMASTNLAAGKPAASCCT